MSPSVSRHKNFFRSGRQNPYRNGYAPVVVTHANGKREGFKPGRVTEDFIDYPAYLDSEEWQRLRRRVLERDGHRCTGCGSEDALQAHHFTYKRISRERLTDLVTLCEGCHKARHGVPMR